MKTPFRRCILAAALLSAGAAVASLAQSGETYEQENLYADGTLIHQVVADLNVIAPDMLIYIVNADESRPAFHRHLKAAPKQDVERLITPERMANTVDGVPVFGHVLLSQVINQNACVITLAPKHLESFSDKRGANKEQATIKTMMHEAVHCGHARMLAKSGHHFKRLVDAHGKQYGANDQAMKTAIKVYAETFVGAYFLANSFAPGRSILLSSMADFAWQAEKEASASRGFSNSFAVIEQICGAGICPTDLEELHNHLLSHDRYLEAMTKDIQVRIAVSWRIASSR